MAWITLAVRSGNAGRPVLNRLSVFQITVPPGLSHSVKRLGMNPHIRLNMESYALFLFLPEARPATKVDLDDVPA